MAPSTLGLSVQVPCWHLVARPNSSEFHSLACGATVVVALLPRQILSYLHSYRSQQSSTPAEGVAGNV